jgi:hypothetical protein
MSSQTSASYETTGLTAQRHDGNSCMYRNSGLRHDTLSIRVDRPLRDQGQIKTDLCRAILARIPKIEKVLF